MNEMLASVGAITFSLTAKLFMARRSKGKRKGCSALVIPKRGLKSSLCTEMNNSRQSLFLDLDSLLVSKGQGKTKEEALVDVKKHLTELRKNFKDKHIFVLCTDRYTAEYLKIKSRNTHYYTPSSTLYNKLVSNIENPQVLESVNNSRTQHLYDLPKKKQLHVYDSLEQLKTLLITQFKLERPL